jgi:predicted RNase H-like nuclease (RuvC/YqgF family)
MKTRELEVDERIKKLRLQLKEKNSRIKHLREQIDFYQGVRRTDYVRFTHLFDAHERIKRKFEANFKFHEYIKDVLDETADLMESANADHRQ